MMDTNKNENQYHDVDEIAPARTCFVISPIGADGSDVRIRVDQTFKHIIRPAAEVNNLVPIRSDHISRPGMITTQIINNWGQRRFSKAIDFFDRSKPLIPAAYMT